MVFCQYSSESERQIKRHSKVLKFEKLFKQATEIRLRKRLTERGIAFYISTENALRSCN